MKEFSRTHCPVCKEPLHLKPISLFDPDCSKYGGMLQCTLCGWDDWGDIWTPEEVKELLSNNNLLLNNGDGVQ